MTNDYQRNDYAIVREWIAPKTRVLDIGCSDGHLLELLQETRAVDGRGIELSQQGVNECVARGLAVIQGDADTDLVNYPTKSFDYTILSKTIQATHSPSHVLSELLRIGKQAIVTFPNFGHWQVRKQFFFQGKMPVNTELPYQWYDTPNIHFCTIRDFIELCDSRDIKIIASVCLGRKGQAIKFHHRHRLTNILAQEAIFLLQA